MSLKMLRTNRDETYRNVSFDIHGDDTNSSNFSLKMQTIRSS
jgi:hypothetical protein